MKKKLLIGTLSTVMSLGFLSGCNTDNNDMNDTRDVNYSPVRYNEMDDDINRGNVRPRAFNENNANRDNTNYRNNVNNRNNTSPVRFDRNGDRDRLDRGIFDVNENNRNGRIFNNNDGNLNDNVNLRRGNNNTGTQQGGGGMFRGR